MELIKLNFGVLIAYVSGAILQIQDSRKASNGNRYSLGDAVLRAFSVFFMQSESFLEHQRQMESHQVKNNAQTLFGFFILELLGSATLNRLEGSGLVASLRRIV